MFKLPKFFSLSFGALDSEIPNIQEENQQKSPHFPSKEDITSLTDIQRLTDHLEPNQQRGPSETP